MSHPFRIPASLLAACLLALAGCSATPPTVHPTTHKSADPTTPTTPTNVTASTDPTPDLVKHAYFGRVLGADGKGVAGVSVKAYIIANNAGQLVTDNGSGLVTDNGSGVIANNAGNIISTDGASGKARHLLAADPTTTDANGEFKMDIPEGQTFNVEAVKDDTSKAFLGQVTSKSTQLDLTLQPTGAIHGKVAYPDDPKVTDFTGVDVFIPGSSYVGKTGPDGSFTLSNVPVGKFDVYATKRGLGGGHVEGITVTAKGTGEIPLLPLKLLPVKLTAISAASGVPGQTLTLTGDYFGQEQGLPFQVRLGGAVLENPKRDDKGQITVLLPDSARSGDLVVEVDGHASNGMHFDVLTGFSVMAPTMMEPGGSIAITASATDPDKHVIANPALAWKVTQGTAATIDAKGTLTASQTPGTVTVTATAGTLVATFKVVVGKGADGVGGHLDSKLYGLKDLAFAPDGKTLYLACQNDILAYDLTADSTSIFAGAASTGGKVSDLEGTGTDARFSGITGLAGDANGNLVALEETCLMGIDKDRHVTILAGTGKDASTKSSDDFPTAKDGDGPAVVLEGPTAGAFDKNGTLFFIDGASLRTLKGTTVAHVSGFKDNVNATDGLFVDTNGVPWGLDFGTVTPYANGQDPISFGLADGSTDNVEEWAGLVRNADGSFYASGDGMLYRIQPDGTTTLLAGGDTGSLADGVGTAARFGSAGRLAMAPDGTLYLAEETALRKITFGADANHPTVTTLLQGTGGLKKVTAVKPK